MTPNLSIFKNWFHLIPLGRNRFMPSNLFLHVFDLPGFITLLLRQCVPTTSPFVRSRQNQRITSPLFPALPGR